MRDYREQQLRQLANVQVYFDSDLDAESVLEFGFPRIVVATGARWRTDGVSLRAWAAYSRLNVDIFYWRTRGGTEVDFVVYGESGLQAFEVKNARKVHSTDLRALRAFRDDYPEPETAVLNRGTDRLRTEGVWCVPVGVFLRRMMPDRGLLAGL